MQISCFMRAQANFARGSHLGLSDPSHPCKLGRIACQYAAVWTPWAVLQGKNCKYNLSYSILSLTQQKSICGDQFRKQ